VHSDHRRRYHVRPAEEIYPGDRVSTDADAIAAIRADADAELPPHVIDDAALILNRNRRTPTRFVFPTSAGPLHLGARDRVLVVQERGDALLDL